MSPVHKLSQIGSLTGNKIDYPSMLAGYGDFGALQRIAYASLSGPGTFFFNNIPTTFQDLRLVCSLRDTNNSGVGVFYFKETTYGYSTTDYSHTGLVGDGSSASSTRNTNNNRILFEVVPSTATSGIFSATTIDILNYANTSTFKTMIVRNATDRNGAGFSQLNVGLWRKTDAVNQIGIYTSTGGSHWAAGSTAALYGVKASAA